MKVLLLVGLSLLVAGPASAQDIVLKAKHSGKCAQVDQLSQANGARISQWDCVNQPNVIWHQVSAGNGRFFFKVLHSGKCAQVNGGSHDNGANITQWDCLNQANVKWRVRAVGGGYVNLINAESGKCMQVDGASNDNGANISQWDCVNQDNVKWLIVPANSSAFCGNIDGCGSAGRPAND